MRRVTAAVAALLAAPALAHAAAPGNDARTSPGEFRAVTAANGTPDEREAIAELAEATADRGVPRCLGPKSFARTVWYRVPAADFPREIAVEGSGRTTDVLDFAAYVGRAKVANACAGRGSGGADIAGEPESGVTLRVPAGSVVLVQIGRRGRAGSAQDEQAVLSLSETRLDATPAPAGDRADRRTPAVGIGKAVKGVPLGGATVTAEDPAQPACPSYGSVWRRVVPDRDGFLTVVTQGAAAGTLTVFRGRTPAKGSPLACTSREKTKGSMRLSVRARRGKVLWIRVGTDRPVAKARAKLRVVRGKRKADGGPGGAPPLVAR